MRSRSFYFIYALLFLVFMSAYADDIKKEVTSQKVENPETNLHKKTNDIMKKYRTSQFVEVNVEKTIKSEWKTKDQVFLGKMFYSKGKFRWENEQPEKNWIIYNGLYLWNIQFSSPDFPGKNKITKSKITKKNREQILLMSLIDMTDLRDKFFLDKNSSESKETDLVVNLEPIEKDPTVQNLKIYFDLKKNQINQISFKDDIGNITSILFRKTIFKSKLNKEKFEFTPNKSDEVTEL